MRKIIAALLLIGIPTNALALERVLTGHEIASLLPKVVATSASTRQTFSDAGATTYVDRGRETYGSWRVEGDKYCSQWPPGDAWSCYSVLHNPQSKQIIWVDGPGNRTVNSILPKQ